MSESSPLLAPDFLAALERLDLLCARAFRGRLKGERRSKRQGRSVEFADYRDYAPGDDPRFLDWNVFGRLDRLFLKLYREEEDRAVHVLLDASRSMDWGEPRKFPHAQQLAGALAALGLYRLDRVRVWTFADTLAEGFGPARGRRQVWPMLRWLAARTCAGRTALAEVCARFAARQRQPGLVVLVSDFLQPAPLEVALRPLLMRAWDVTCLQVLAREELAPPWEGDFLLVDCEHGERRQMNLDDAARARYRAELERFTRGFDDLCRRWGWRYVLSASDQPFEDVLFTALRQRGLIG